MPETRRLEALTSLRFFAAAAIVLVHLHGHMGVELDLLHGWMYGHAVSFFFVLSGFILAYVYRDLGGGDGTGRFLVARVARIWPAHVTAFLLLVILVDIPGLLSGSHLKQLLANLTLVHAWIPSAEYFFSYNAPSWSISTEFFFYLCFPLLVVNWERTWWWKIGAAVALTVGVISLCNLLGLEPYQTTNKGLNSTAFVYVNPVSRLTEFVFGVAAGKLFLRLPRHQGRRGAWFTLLELTALGAVLAVSRYADALGGMLQPYIGMAGHEWLRNSGLPPVSAALILVMAMERGALSALLSRPWLVLLGEISYSIYLVHHILLRAYSQRLALFDGWPNWLQIVLFLLVTVTVSWLIWRFVERPSRRFLVGLWDTRSAPSWSRGPWAWRALPLGTVAMGASVALPVVFASGVLVPFIHQRSQPLCLIDGEDRQYQEVAGATFGESLVLRQLTLLTRSNQVELHLEWETLPGDSKRLFNAVHLLSADGKLVTNADAAQPEHGPADAPPGETRTWTNSILLSRQAFRGIRTLGFGVYDANAKLLSIDRGNRDSGGGRLLLPLCDERIHRMTDGSDASLGSTRETSAI